MLPNWKKCFKPPTGSGVVKSTIENRSTFLDVLGSLEVTTSIYIYDWTRQKLPKAISAIFQKLLHINCHLANMNRSVHILCCLSFFSGYVTTWNLVCQCWVSRLRATGQDKPLMQPLQMGKTTHSATWNNRPMSHFRFVLTHRQDLNENI